MVGLPGTRSRARKGCRGQPIGGNPLQFGTFRIPFALTGSSYRAGSRLSKDVAVSRLNELMTGSLPAGRRTVGKPMLGLLFALCLVLAACGGEPLDPNQGNPPDSTSCATATAISLTAGQATVVDPSANNGCIRFPAADAGGAEYLIAAAATNGHESAAGSSTGYELRAVQG